MSDRKAVGQTYSTPAVTSWPYGQLELVRWTTFELNVLFLFGTRGVPLRHLTRALASPTLVEVPRPQSGNLGPRMLLEHRDLIALGKAISSALLKSLAYYHFPRSP